MVVMVIDNGCCCCCMACRFPYVPYGPPKLVWFGGGEAGPRPKLVCVAGGEVGGGAGNTERWDHSLWRMPFTGGEGVLEHVCGREVEMNNKVEHTLRVVASFAI